MQKISKFLFLFLLALAPVFLSANPQGGEVTEGTANISSQDKNLIISQSSEKAIIQWQEFSIANGEKTQFNLPSEQSSTLNRVVGGNISEIYGELKSNGALYLVNPNGVMIGPSGKVDVSSFIASTFDLSDKDYLSGTELNFKEALSSSLSQNILNQGTVHAAQGDIILIAKEIDNRGSLSAEKGKVSLNAGYELYLLPAQQMKSVVRLKKSGQIKSSGMIKAAEAEIKASGGSAYALAIEAGGLIDAVGLENRDGRIILTSEDGVIDVTGKFSAHSQNKTVAFQENINGNETGELKEASVEKELTANNAIGGTVHLLGDVVKLEKDALINVSGINGGGEVLIGGDYQGKNPEIKNASYVYMDKKAAIHADSLENGNGGKVILWSDKGTDWRGFISAEGGKESGDGGFVEVSSHGFFNPIGIVNTEALYGETGIFLLDPYNVSIATNGGSDTNISWDGGAPTNTATPTNTGAVVAVAVLQTNLASTHVVISTVNGVGGEDGNITVANSVTWSSAKKLTLSAENKVVIDGGVTISSTNAGGNFDAIEITGAGGASGTYAGVDNAGTITADQGNITITGTGGDTGILNYGVRNAGTISTTGNTAAAGNIVITGHGGPGSNINYGVVIENSGSTINTLNGTITIIGDSNGTGSNACGVVLYNQAQVSSTAATVDITGTANASATGGNNDGVRVDGNNLSGTKFYSSGGTLTITGTGGGTGGASDNNNGIWLREQGVIATGGNVDLVMIGTKGSVGAASKGIIAISGTDIGQSTAPATAGAVTLETDTTSYAGNIYTTGDLILQPKTASLAINIGTIGTNYITLANLLAYTAGHSITYIGKSGGTHAITLGGGGADVVVNSNNTTFRGQDITVVTDDLTCASAVKMSLLASKTITVSSAIRNTNAGGTNFDAITLTASAGVATTNYVGVTNSGTLTSVWGNINITGTGGSGGAGAGNYGVYNTGTISTTGNLAAAGTITITGTGGAGTDTNYGVFNNGVSGIIKTDSGDLNVTGTGGAGSSANNYGVLNYNGAWIYSTGATVTINGTGGAGTTNNYGVFNNDAWGGNWTRLFCQGTALVINGTGGAGTDSNYGIYNLDDGEIYSQNAATITLTGIGAGTGIGNIGIKNSFSSITSYGSGAVTITGTGSTGGTSSNYGIANDPTAIITTATGNLKVTGYGKGSTTDNYGIYNSATSSIRSTDSAAVTIEGTGGSGTNVNYGIYNADSSALLYSTSGALRVTGTGGGTGTNNYGIYNTGGGQIYSTGSTVTLSGTGGSGTNYNEGVNQGSDASRIYSTGGNLSITGVGGTGGVGADNNNYGIVIASASEVYTTSTYSVIFNGTGGSGTTANFGLLLFDTCKVYSASGTVQITGIEGAGTNNYGINAVAGTSIGKSATTTGAITLTADTVSYAGDIYTTGVLTLQPNTASLAIGIGTAGTNYITLANLLAYTAGHSITYIGKSGGSHVITLGGGGADAVVNTNATTFRGQDITVVTDDLTCASAVKMSLLASKTITVSSAIRNANAGGVNFDAIDLTASGGVAATNYRGVTNSGGTITSVWGNISVTGIGGSGGGGASNEGVRNIGVISTTGNTAAAGTVTITGTGGAGTDTNYGIHNVSTITTASGALSVTGTGGAGSGANNYGIYNHVGQIYSTGSTVTVNGTGGAGTTDNDGIRNNADGLGGSNIYSQGGALLITGNGGNGTNSNRGIYNMGAASFYATGSATLTLNGTGNGTGTDNYGIENTSSSQIYSTGSTVTLAGTGSTSGTSTNYGVYNNGSGSSNTKIYSQGGTLSITGTGGGSGLGDINHGVYNYNSGLITSTTPAITITGTKGNGSSSVGIKTAAATDDIGETGGVTTGPITLTADTVSYAGDIYTTGDLTLQPNTASLAIGIGTAGTNYITEANLSSYTTDHATTFIGRSDGSHTVTLGDASGSLTVNNDTTFRGDVINLTETLTVNNSSDLVFLIGQTAAGTLTLGGDVSSAATLTMTGSTFTDVFNINVNTTSAVPATSTLNGGTIGATTNTLVSPNLTNSWTISGANAGTLGNITFSNVTNITGGSGTDTFTVAAALDPTMTINGGAGSNALIKTDGTNAWAITSVTGTQGNGTVGNITFNRMDTLTGGTGDDTFTVTAALNPTMTLNGGSGSDALIKNDASHTWYVTSISSGAGGTVGNITFSGMDEIKVATGGNPELDLQGYGSGVKVYVTGSVQGQIKSIGDVLLFNYFYLNGIRCNASVTNTLVGTVGTSYVIYDYNWPNVDGYQSVYNCQNLIVQTAGATIQGRWTGSIYGYLDGTVTGNASDTILNLSVYGASTPLTFTMTGAYAGGVTGVSPPPFSSFADISTITANATPANVLIGPDSGATFNITGAAAGNITGSVNFTNFSTLTGGSGNDIFNIGADFSGNLNGGGGNDNFVFGGAYQVTSGIDGGTGTDTITGPDVVTAWATTGNNAGTITPTGASGATFFSNIQTLTGGTNNDTFTIAHNMGTINLNAGTNTYGQTAGTVTTLNANSGTNTFNLSGTATLTTINGNTGTNDFNFNAAALAITTLTAGSVSDTFDFAVGSSVTGTIALAAGGTKVLDYADYGAAISVNLQTPTATGIGTLTGAAGITNIIGAAMPDFGTITGMNAGHTFTVNGANSGTIATGITSTFSNINALVGGNGTDVFDIDTGGSLATIQGGVGTNTYNIGGGDVTTSITGGAGSDSFVFTDAKVVSGTVDGGAGGTNSLNYNAYTTAVTINLQTSAATGIFGGAAAGFSNIDTFIGGTNANNAATAPNAVNTWTFTLSSFDDFTLLSGATTYNFQNFPYVVGGSTNDTFVFGNGSGINGTLDGGAGGTNTLDYSSHTDAFSISFMNNSASNIFSGAVNGFTNINNFIGPGNTFYGPNFDCDYFITGGNSGYVDVPGMPLPITFSGIANIIAGSQADSFTFEAAGSLSGFIGGGLGINTCSFAPKTAGVTVTMTGANAGTVSTNILATGFVNINSFTGSSIGADQFIFNSGGSLSGYVNGSGGTSNRITDLGSTARNWYINGGSAGTVNLIGGGFSNIQDIVGGSENDRFQVTSGGFIDYINGSGGYNTLDLYYLSYPQTYYYEQVARSGWVQGIVGAFNNIDLFILPYTPRLRDDGVADRVTIETLQDQIFYEKGYTDELKQLLDVIVPEDYLWENLDVRNSRTHHWWKNNEADSMQTRIAKNTAAKSATKMPDRTFYEKGYTRGLEDTMKAVTPFDYLRKDVNVREEEPKLKKKKKSPAQSESEKFRWWKTSNQQNMGSPGAVQASMFLNSSNMSYDDVSTISYNDSQNIDNMLLVAEETENSHNKRSRAKSAKTMPDRTFYEKGYTRSLRKLMKVVVPFDYLRRSVEVREKRNVQEKKAVK